MPIAPSASWIPCNSSKVEEASKSSTSRRCSATAMQRLNPRHRPTLAFVRQTGQHPVLRSVLPILDVICSLSRFHLAMTHICLRGTESTHLRCIPPTPMSSSSSVTLHILQFASIICRVVDHRNDGCSFRFANPQVGVGIILEVFYLVGESSAGAQSNGEGVLHDAQSYAFNSLLTFIPSAVNQVGTRKREVSSHYQ